MPSTARVQHFGRVVLEAQAGEWSDGRLLEEFIARRDEVAFQGLVRRHGPMVFGVCRRILCHRQDAEDAFQATFIVLARRAASIGERERLGNWLYGVAYRTALEARRLEARRRTKERQVGDMPQPAVEPKEGWPELGPVLDEELSRLPDELRLPVVLCDLEGRTRREVARQLAVPEGTLSNRLATARRRLAKRLSRRGLTLSAGMLAGLLSRTAAASRVPAPLIVSTARAVTGPAAGLISTNVIALTEGVQKAMLLSKLKSAGFVVALLGAVLCGAILLGPVGSAAEEPKTPAANPSPPAPAKAAGPKADVGQLAGTWLFETAAEARGSRLGQAWTSTLSVTGDTFQLSKFLGLSKDLKGKFVLDPAADPQAIDVTLEELDLSEGGPAMKVPVCTQPGIYKREGDRLTICLSTEAGGKRPTTFDPAGHATILITLVKASPRFQAFPDEVTVRVTGPDGKPAAGVTVAHSMSLRWDPKNQDSKREWEYHQPAKTDVGGTVKMKYADLGPGLLVARDPQNKQMALASLTPVSLLKGEVTVALEPECRVDGTIVCAELKKAGKPIGWTNVYVMRDGRCVAMCSSLEGTFELVLPPGTYTLEAYGSDVKRKNVAVTVPNDRSAFTVEPIALSATKLVLLRGQPAPELDGVVCWRGTPVRLADLKGKYVLLEFWGYWCGPCVAQMPVLIELHEKFADKGLAIVGVHMDGGGEVDTAAKLDEKIAVYKEKLWQGKDLPFPVALTSGKRVGDGEARVLGGAAGQYGVVHFPTTILIDRDGKVVGEFGARDAKTAAEQVEKLLNEKK